MRKGQRSRKVTSHTTAANEKRPVAEASEAVERKPWGLGGPVTLDLSRIKTTDLEVAGIFDLHGEWVEPKLFDAQLSYIKDTQPDVVVLGGDIDNFDIISRWQEKILNKMTPLEIMRETKREIDIGRRNRARVREAAGDALVVECEGNHGDRYRKYLSDDLHEGWTEAIRLRHLEESLDGYYNRSGFFLRPRFLVRHGDTTAQNPAKKEYNISRCSGWTGHLHKVDSHFEPPFTNSGERFVHTIAPASCRLDANYGSGNAGLMQWHQGMLAGSFSMSDPHDHTTDIGMWNGKHLRIRGEKY